MTAEEYIKKIEDLQETAPEQVLAVCDEALATYPNETKLYYLKALTLWHQSEVFDVPQEEFSALLKKATDLDPHYSDPHCLWAYANELLGYPELALHGYQRAVDANPDDMEALGKVGEMEQKLGDLPAALKTFDKLISRIPPSDRAYNSRGHIRRELKDYTGAMEDFNKVLEINPQAGGSLWGRGLCKKELGDLAGAIEDFSQFITLFPQEAFGYMDRAAVKVLQNDLIGALKDYQSVIIQIDPKNERAWTQIANLQNQLLQQIPANTPVLHSTLKSGHQAMTAPINGEMVLFLVPPNADINTPDQFGETPLLKAAKKGQTEEVKNLIAQGADVNFVDRFAESVLMAAIKKNHVEIVKLLIEAGADVNYKDPFKKSVLALAEQKGYTEIIDLLKSAGAKE